MARVGGKDDPNATMTKDPSNQKNLPLAPNYAVAQLRLENARTQRTKKRFLNFSYDDLNKFYHKLKTIAKDKNEPLNKSLAKLSYTNQKETTKITPSDLKLYEQFYGTMHERKAVFENYINQITVQMHLNGKVSSH